MSKTIKTTKTMTKILAALTEAPTALTTREVAKLVGVTAPTALNNCEKLLKLGQVERGPMRGNAYTFQAGEVEPVQEPERKPEPGKCECQVCERYQVLNTKYGTIWNHGYQRPGFGWLVGGCPGADRKPFPFTDALESYLVLVEDRAQTVTQTLANQDNWTTVTYERFTGKYAGRRQVYETVVLNRPTAEERAESDRAYEAYSDLSRRDYLADTDQGEALTSEERETMERERETWLHLHKTIEKWGSTFASQVRRLEGEAVGLAREIERVSARIAKGQALRAQAEAS